MDFGVVLQTDPPTSGVVELARLAELHGFSHAWTFDSHVLWQEPFVVYSQMLAATDRIVVGPMVTNPGTRDWTVLGSLFATLNDTYGPRTICGMGRGDSALCYIWRKPAPLATMSESMKVIKGLVAGDSVMYKDVRLRLRWVDEHGWDLPMWVAGYGPKALDLVGRESDGFILQLADAKILEWTMEAVKSAARKAGRDPDEIDFCVAAPAYVGAALAPQRHELRWFGGMVGNHVEDLVARYGGDGSTVPRALTDFIKDRKDYDYLHHGKRKNPSADFVPEAVVDRFCVLGTAADHIAKLTELRDIGVDQFAIYLMHDANEATVEAYGQEIIPALQ